MYILKEVCFMTTSFPAIHFLYYSVIISRVCLLRVCLFQENNCGPAFLEVPIYSTELVAIFFLKSTVLNAQKHLQRSHSFMVNQHSEITFTFSKILKHSAVSEG